MSFCCGASMVGTIGTLKHQQTYIHQVPILYCPICQFIEVHPKIKDDYEILSEYAQSDHAPEIYFDDYVNLSNIHDLFSDCIDIEEHSMVQVLRSQIDHALDLVSVAKSMKDEQWKEDLFYRLGVLSERLKRYEKQEAQQKR